MRLGLRLKLTLAFFAVAAVTVFLASFVPLRISMYNLARDNQDLLRGQMRALAEQRQIYLETVDRVLREISQDPAVLRIVRSGNLVAAEEEARHLLPRQSAIGIEVLVLPPDLAQELKRAFQAVSDEEKNYVVRSSDFGRPEHKAYKGTLGAVRGEREEILAGVFVGFPIISDLRRHPVRGSGYQEPGPSIEVDRERLGLTASVDLIHPDNPIFQRYLENRPELRRLLFEEKDPADSDDFPQFGQDFQVRVEPVLGLDGEIVSIVSLRTPKPTLFATWREIQNLFYLALVVSLLLAVILALIIGRSIARPVGELAERARAITAGDLSEPVPVRSQDEIGELAGAFNQMQKELHGTLEELRRKYRELDRTVQELSRTKEYTENVLQNVKAGVITFDLGRRVTQINEAATGTLSLADIPTADVEEFLEGTALFPLVAQGLESGRTVSDLEMEIRTWDDRVIPVEVGTSLLLESGRTIGVVLSFRDLSAVKSLEEQVRRQDRLASLGHLSAGLAHEIRNPLGIIHGCARILKRRFQGKDGEDGLTDQIMEEVARLKDVVTNFLDFARPKRPRIQEGDLNATIEKALALAEHHRGGGRIEVRMDLDRNLPSVPIDPEQFEQVFLNLTLNSLEAMSEGGVLHVESRMDGRHVLVVFRDTGSGIEPDKLSAIFNPFFTTKPNGTGLGLSVVHQIIESHHGRIEVRSELGKGSEFRVLVPLGEKEESEA